MKLSFKGSLLAATFLMVILLTVNSRIYVYPDFISVSVGLLAGFYGGGWIAWIIFKNFVSVDRIDKRFSIFAVASTLLLVNIISVLT
jgi:hypothetical protein